MFETRKEKLGLVGARSPKRLASSSKKQLAEIRRRLERLSAPYEDIDATVEVELRSLLGAFDQFEQKINDTVKYLDDYAPY